MGARGAHRRGGLIEEDGDRARAVVASASIEHGRGWRIVDLQLEDLR